ncbi:unnamed protein product [Ilex paraguariensis]|uniref:Uncharacterized protein n=1 Tax=Ilex paraguariensis TaxID=185542 RepID=A0ABC8RGH4_9AQUA
MSSETLIILWEDSDTIHCLSAAKKNEIQYLMDMLKRVEEQKCIISARVELLRKETQDFSGAADAIEKQYCDPMIHD